MMSSQSCLGATTPPIGAKSCPHCKEKHLHLLEVDGYDLRLWKIDWRPWSRRFLHWDQTSRKAWMTSLARKWIHDRYRADIVQISWHILLSQNQSQAKTSFSVSVLILSAACWGGQGSQSQFCSGRCSLLVSWHVIGFVFTVFHRVLPIVGTNLPIEKDFVFSFS